LEAEAIGVEAVDEIAASTSLLEADSLEAGRRAGGGSSRGIQQCK